MLDTHVLVWWLGDRARLGERHARRIDTASRSRPVVVSAISVFEIATAVRRGRLVLSLPLDRWLADLRSLPELRIEPIGADIAERAAGYDAQLHGDPADRLILATAHVLVQPLATLDARLRAGRVVPMAW